MSEPTRIGFEAPAMETLTEQLYRVLGPAGCTVQGVPYNANQGWLIEVENNQGHTRHVLPLEFIGAMLIVDLFEPTSRVGIVRGTEQLAARLHAELCTDVAHVEITWPTS